MAKRKFKLDTTAVIRFVILFIIAVAVFTLVRFKAAKLANQRIFQGNKENQQSEQQGDDVTDPENEEPEIDPDLIWEAVAPMVVDESSPYYEMYMNTNRVNILLCGLADGNTDTIMVLSYDMDTHMADVISIPRDTYYHRSGYKNYGAMKINAIYRGYKNPEEGIARLASAVSEILYGMPIHYYCIVEYDGIREMMDIIGGVKVNVPFHFKYEDPTPGYELYIDIPEGEQMITSENVIEFLRFRHTNPKYARQGYKSYFGGDIQRTETQRQFMVAALKETMRGGNVLKVAKAALSSPNFNSNLTYGIAVKIAKNVIGGLDPDSVDMFMLPGTDDMINNLSFWVMNSTKTGEMMQEIYAVPEEEPESTSGAAVDQ